MDQIDLVIFEFPGNYCTVRLITLGVLSINLNVLALNKALFCQGSREAFGIVIKGWMGHNLGFTDTDHLG